MVYVVFGLLWVALIAGSIAAYGVRPGRAGHHGPWPRWVWPAIAVAILSLVVAIPSAAIIFSRGERKEVSRTGVVLTDAQQRGREIFGDLCKRCHTLADASAASTVGPNLDVMKPTFDVTVDAILYGRARGGGQMPRGLADAAGARDVASYLEAVAGRD